MSETPDFEQIARSTTGFIRDRDPERLQALELNIIDLLRLVWNARGAADAETITPSLKYLVTLAKAKESPDVLAQIRALDR